MAWPSIDARAAEIRHCHTSIDARDRVLHVCVQLAQGRCMKVNCQELNPQPADHIVSPAAAGVGFFGRGSQLFPHTDPIHQKKSWRITDKKIVR